MTYAGDPAFDGAHAFDAAYGYGEGAARGLTLDAIIYLSTRPPFCDSTWRERLPERVRNGAANLSLDEHARPAGPASACRPRTTDRALRRSRFLGKTAPSVHFSIDGALIVGVPRRPHPRAYGRMDGTFTI